MANRGSRRTSPALGSAPPMRPADMLWKHIRRLREFTLRQMVSDSRVNRGTAEHYLSSLTLARIVRRVRLPADTYSGEENGYRLIRDVGVDRPRVRRDGTVVDESDKSRAWRAMRILKCFSARAIEAHSGAHLENIKSFIYALRQSGFLAITHEARPDNPARYLLVRNSGPRSPLVRRDKHVFDPNTGTAYSRISKS